MTMQNQKTDKTFFGDPRGCVGGLLSLQDTQVGSTESLPTGFTSRPVVERAVESGTGVISIELRMHEGSGSEARRPVGRDSVEP